MARILGMRTPVVDTVCGWSRLLGLLVTLCVHLSDQLQRAAPSYDQGSPMCYSNFFPCFQDCCETGTMFCHHRDQRCYKCDTRRQLCGNESLPRDCLLYCYKIQNPPSQSSDCDNDLTPLLFILGITGAVVLTIILTLVVLTCITRRRPPEKWPACIRWLLLGPKPLQQRFYDAESKKDPDEDQAMIPPSHSHHDVNAGRPLNDSNSPSRASTLGTHTDSANTNLDVLNVATKDKDNNDDDDDGRDPTTAQGPPPPLPAACSADIPEPGQRQPIGGSLGEGMQPSAGQGAQTGNSHSAAQSHGTPPRSPPQTTPQPPVTTRDAGEGLGMSQGGGGGEGGGGGLAPARDGIESSSAHRRPEPEIDIQVGGNVFHGGTAAETPQGRHHSGNVNTPSAPDFSLMNPTRGTDDEDDDRHIVVPGADDPTKSYSKYKRRA